jgi:hypothetical protein
VKFFVAAILIVSALRGEPAVPKTGIELDRGGWANI